MLDTMNSGLSEGINHEMHEVVMTDLMELWSMTFESSYCLIQCFKECILAREN